VSNSVVNSVNAMVTKQQLTRRQCDWCSCSYEVFGDLD